ncbi:unnamed protein product [Eruca vesicaria subsp. sativa]|uniref:Uncharacterized protein n=1 Tax=Eruca vesicaria subsp. sativa TaxID=29727 RepID=A0ABC8JEL6_ERUVS|nr:unnamed protein product [Eruca vesicaria subsp. sativa]
MSSMMETLQIRKQTSLPVSQLPNTDDNKPGIIRRGIASLSLNLSNKPKEISVSAIRDQARNWWEWSCSWILSKKLDQSAHHISEEV